MHKQRIPAVIG